MCIDYRAINNNTIIDRYPMPRIDDILDRLGGSTIFSKIDLASGYHQVEIDEEHRHRTAFQSRFGLFEYNVVPFGLCNAPATFQRLMHQVLSAGLDKHVTVYLDDILVFSKDPTSHEQHVQWVFDQLRKHGLKAKRKKCEFGMDHLEYLGHVISKEGISADPGKTDAVAKWPTPTSKRELQTFLGLANYYAKLIKHFAWHAHPLYQLLRKDIPWHWTTEHNTAVQKLKDALCNAPVLALPNFDLPFTI